MTSRSDETRDHAYTEPGVSGLCLAVARDGEGAFVVALPERGKVTLGRETQADLRIHSSALSRVHCSITTRGEQVSVQDLGSRNGTRLGGERIAEGEQPWSVGEEVAVGEVRLTLLRRAALPTGTLCFWLLRDFEATYIAEPAHVLALKLAAPLGHGKGPEVLGQLPADLTWAVASDQIVLCASTSPGPMEWLEHQLAARPVPLGRSATLHKSGTDFGFVHTLMGRITEPQGTPDDPVPIPFRYPSLRKLHAEISRVAARNLNVLVRGETGTGKELVAREIHRLSGRHGALVAINAAALPENLIESELFGFEKGAFSGAQTAKQGLIEASDHGTLFLDEIGELPLALQAKLLRVFEDGTVRRLGGTSEKHVDFRIVAATHQDLEALVREKRFRQDLFFRLSGASVEVPPLRERRDEILPLSRQLLLELSRLPTTLSAEAEQVLSAYGFPGNVRELKNALERALAYAEGGVVELAHLPGNLRQSPSAFPPPETGDVRTSVRDFERDRIMEALRQTGGNRTRAAELLGLPRRTLVYKLSKLRLGEDE